MRFVMVLVFCAFLLTTTSVFASLGHLTHVSGLVKVYQNETASWVNGRSGLIISSGDRLKTTDGGTAVLSYDDGSELRIRESSSVQFLSAGYRLRYGNTWVRFVKQGNHFRTVTPNSVVSVRGTIYTVGVNRDLPAVMSDYKTTILNSAYASQAPRAHVASSSLLLSLLERAGAFSKVQVYRGAVAVAPVAVSGQVLEENEQMLTKGMELSVKGSEVSTPVKIASLDESYWNDDFFSEKRIPSYQKRIEQIKKHGAAASLKSQKREGFKLLGEESSSSLSGGNDTLPESSFE